MRHPSTSIAGAAAAVLLALAAVPAAAQQPSQREQETVPEFEATLEGHAVLPAHRFVPPPADAPASFMTSGRFTTDDATRADRLYSVVDENTGLARPFAGQPLQGFSGIRHLGDGEYLVLTDNGFGNRRNSPDALLMFHRLRPDWDTGRVEILDTTFLSDPERVVPFQLTTEHSDTRYLTGADLDIESIQPVGDRYWFGDEFGPYILATNRDGEVIAFHETSIDGETIRSPDHYAVKTPDTPGPVAFEARRSRGYEGMALSQDGRTLYPMLEGPVLDEAGTPETIDGREVLRILAFDIEAGSFGDTVRYYPLEQPGHAIGDFNMIDATRALVIERDSKEGDPRIAAFEEPAAFKRIYLVDLGQTDDNGVVEKLGYIDLLNIQDPDGVARRGTMDGVFTFPFVTIEDVDRVDETRIVVANDNNYPFSVGREPGVADDNEFILLEVGEFLRQGR